MILEHSDEEEDRSPNDSEAIPERSGDDSVPDKSVSGVGRVRLEIAEPGEPQDDSMPDTSVPSIGRIRLTEGIIIRGSGEKNVDEDNQND